MNIVQIQDMLRFVPDDKLKEELSNPNGPAPQYLVLSEVVRRDKLRGGNAEKPATTVVQDVLGAGQQPPQGFASGGFISASESMGNAGVAGYPTQQPKFHNPVSANTGITSMFAPSPAPKPAPPQTVNNVQVTQPQPHFDDGQSNTFDSPSYYEQGAYAHGGPVKMAAGDYVSRIGAVEASGDPRAKNSLSTAGGLGQFIDSTWLSYLNATQPGLVDRIGKKAALELKYDPDLSNQATAWYADQNTKALSSAGFEPSRGNLYLAHFLGPAGATSVLGANPNTPAVDILGKKVADANPFIKKMTAADLINWTANKMGDGAGGSGQQGKPMSFITDLFYGRPMGAGQGAAGFEARAEGLPSPSMATRTGGIMELVGLKPGTTGADQRRADLKSAGATMMQQPQIQAPKMEMSPGNVQGLARLYSDPAQMAQAMTDYGKYMGAMASGGAVRMADGDVVPGIEGFPYIPEEPFYGAEFNPDVVKQAIEFSAQNPAGDRGPLGPGGEPRSIGKVTDWKFSPAEQAAAQATIESKQPPKDEPSGPTPLDKLLDYYKSRDEQMGKLYQQQIDEERRRMEENGGMGAFLRRMGIGMLSDSSSLGRSIQAGAATAASSTEEGKQQALDRIRELQLKQQMAGLTGGEERAKLAYEAAIAGDLTKKDYIDLYNKASENYTKLYEARVKDNPGITPDEIMADPAIKAAKAKVDYYGSKVGEPGAFASGLDPELLSEARRRGIIK